MQGKPITPPKSGSPVIDYAFVPGIFIKALTRAYTISTPVVLLIDEINRGDIYEILGEVFQLMERENSGIGSYSMSLNQEAMNHIYQKLSNSFNELNEDDLSTLCHLHGIDVQHADEALNAEEEVVEVVEEEVVEVNSGKTTYKDK